MPVHSPHSASSDKSQRGNTKFLANHVNATKCAGSHREDRVGQFLNESKSQRQGDWHVLQESQMEIYAWSPVKFPSSPPHSASQARIDRGNMREWFVRQAVDRCLQRRTFPTCSDACHRGDSIKQEQLLSALRQAVQQNSKQAHRAGNWTEPAAYQ